MKKFLNLFFCVGLFRLYFGGGGSSSASASTTYNTDKRIAVGDGGIGLSADNSQVSLSILETDGGAVDRALQTVDLSNAIAGEGYSKLIDASRDLFTQSQGLIGQTQKSVADAWGQAQSEAKGSIDNRTITVLAVAGVAALFAFTRKK